MLDTSRMALGAICCITSSSKIGLPFTQARTLTRTVLEGIRLTCLVPLFPAAGGRYVGGASWGGATWGGATWERNLGSDGSSCCERATRGVDSAVKSAAR